MFPCVTQIYRTQRSIGGYSKSLHQVMQLQAGTEKIHLLKSIVVFSAALQNTQCRSDQTRRESCPLLSIAGQHLWYMLTHGSSQVIPTLRLTGNWTKYQGFTRTCLPAQPHWEPLPGTKPLKWHSTQRIKNSSRHMN